MAKEQQEATETDQEDCPWSHRGQAVNQEATAAAPTDRERNREMQRLLD